MGTKRRTESKEERRWTKAILVGLVASLQDTDMFKNELAERMGWDPRAMYRVFQGRKTLRLVDFIRIARALGEDPGRLLGRFIQGR